eukprot:6023098-Amphidinium_carterae.1
MKSLQRHAELTDSSTLLYSDGGFFAIASAGESPGLPVVDWPYKQQVCWLRCNQCFGCGVPWVRNKCDGAFVV